MYINPAKIISILVIGLFIGASVVPIIRGLVLNLKNDYILDQSQTDGSYWVGITSLHTFNVQTFKPSLSNIGKIELYLKTNFDSGSFKVLIREGLDGDILKSWNGDIREVATTGESWYTFLLDNSIPVIPDNTYSINIEMCEDYGMPNYLFWGRTNSDLYDRGEAFQCISGEYCVQDFDFKFKTYAIDGGGENQPPTCSLSASPTSGDTPLEVTFTMSASDSDGSIDFWELNIDNSGSAEYDGSGSPPSSKTYTYNTPGVYTAKLKVWDDDGESDAATRTITVEEDEGDTNPPTPNPSTWDTEPYQVGAESIKMVATQASDPNGVEYKFKETTGNGQSSGWQNSRTYTDNNLEVNEEYTYKVRTRDKSENQNKGDWSPSRSVNLEDMATSTIFFPPYDGTFSPEEYDTPMGGEVPNENCKAIAAANVHDGDIVTHAYSNYQPLTVTCRAFAMQRLDIPFGRTKDITVNAKLVLVHGVCEEGLISPWATAGTQACWAIDDTHENYHYYEIDPFFDPFDILENILFALTYITALPISGELSIVLNILSGSLDTMLSLSDLLDLLDQGLAEIIPVSFTFTAHEGTNHIYIGTSSLVSTFLIDEKANATSFGQVMEVEVDGYSPPNNPEIEGPEKGNKAESSTFHFSCSDPNYDPIQYKIKWGDGQSTDWSEFCDPPFYMLNKNHIYDDAGVYTIEVTARDIDGLDAAEIATHTIAINADPPVPKCSYMHIPGTYMIFVNASESYDPDGGSLEYRWDWTNNGKYTSWSSDPEATHDYESGSSYTLTLQVKDDEGDTAELTDNVHSKYKIPRTPFQEIIGDILQNHPFLFTIIQRFLIKQQL